MRDEPRTPQPVQRLKPRCQRDHAPGRGPLKSTSLALAMLAVGLLLAACSNPFARPTIEEFSASPDTLAIDDTTDVTLSWIVSHADSLVLSSDRDMSIDVTGDEQHTVAVTSETTFTLTARSALGATTSSTLVIGPDTPDAEPPGEEPPGDEPPGDEPPSDPPPDDDPPAGDAPSKILILIAGQSNAGGRGTPFPAGKAVADDGVYMLREGPSASDWQWVEAAEPSDTYPEAKGHSFLVTLGNDLKRATGKDIYLVQAAVGGSAMRHWLPGGDSGYFDEALARAQFAAADLGVDVSAVTWFQGESDTQYRSERELYQGRTEQVFEAFHDRLPGSPPVLFVQLAKRLVDGVETGRNLAFQSIREMQRGLDHGAVGSVVVAPGSNPPAAGDAPAYYRMVVSHDLPMSDEVHVSRDAQQLLGRRLAHAFLSEFWAGEGARAAERRGPQLLRIERTGDKTLRVVLSRAVNTSSSYDGYFAVFVDGVEQALASVGRDAADSRAIVLATSQALPSSNGRIAVRYMPPDDLGLHISSSEAVHAVDEGTGLRLPLAAFGSPAEAVPASFIQSQ